MWIAWGIGLVGLGGWAFAQRRLEAAVAGLPEPERATLSRRSRPAEVAAVAGGVGGLAVFFGFGRGRDAMLAAVAVFVVNATLLAGARWWLARGLGDPRPYRFAAVVHAITSALAFGGVAAALVAGRGHP